MSGFLGKFWRDQSGATAIEYAFLAAGIGMAIAVVIKEVGSEVNAIFVAVKNLF